MGHFYPKSSNFGIFNPLNLPYQGDFKRKCVSPIKREFDNKNRSVHVGWVER